MLFSAVLSKLSPTLVPSSSTAFLVVVFSSHDLYLSFFFAILFHRFEVQFCTEKEKKIDALNEPK